MKLMKRIIALHVLGLGAFASVGCDTGDGEMIGGRAYPPVGSYVTVQFRRDYLGVGGEARVGVMGEAAAQPVASGGTLKRIGDEFLVLSVENEPDRELWIPREAILLLDVRRPQ